MHNHSKLVHLSLMSEDSEPHPRSNIKTVIFVQITAIHNHLQPTPYYISNHILMIYCSEALPLGDSIYLPA